MINVGVSGHAEITMSDDASEVHPTELVTVQVQVPGKSPDIVVLVDEPAIDIPSGLRIRVQLADAGKPDNTTLPEGKEHVGCEIVPIIGGVGVTGCAGIRTFADGAEKHPAAFVTVQLYVPDNRPSSVVLVPVPVDITVPGYLVKVHVPVPGKPFNITLPVDKVHVGIVIFPTVGAAGIEGCADITTLADEGEMHPAELVTVKVYIPSAKFETIVLVPDPGIVIPPGVRIRVQVPEAGNPFNNTLPVDAVQVG